GPEETVRTRQACILCTIEGISRGVRMTTFHIEIVKPSHYDKDGYVIQWWKAWIPSNSMACLYAISQECAQSRILGDDVEIEVNAYDEMNIRIPIERITSQ